MPRVTRKPKRRREQWAPEVIEHLREGHDLPCMMHTVDHSDGVMREAWEELRHEVLPEYIRQYPGTRPWAWWKFDAPPNTRRERKDGVHPFDNKERTLHVANSDSKTFWERAYELVGGLPRAIIPPFDSGIKTESFEAEWEYLQRLGLLLPEDSPEQVAGDTQCQE